MACQLHYESQGSSTTSHVQGMAHAGSSMNVSLRAPPLANGITKRAEVVSDINLNSFLHWAQEVDAEKLRRTLAEVNIRVHLSSLDGLVEDPPLRIRGQEVRQKPCNRLRCVRCDTQKGGYYFNYCSRQWTPQLSLVSPSGLPASPDQARFLCAQVAWPAGLLRDGSRTEAIVQQLADALSRWGAQVNSRGLTWAGRTPGLSKAERAELRRRQYLEEARGALACATGASGSGQVQAVGLAGTFGLADETAVTSSLAVLSRPLALPSDSLEWLGRKGVIEHQPRLGFAGCCFGSVLAAHRREEAADEAALGCTCVGAFLLPEGGAPAVHTPDCEQRHGRASRAAGRFQTGCQTSAQRLLSGSSAGWPPTSRSRPAAAGHATAAPGQRG